LTKAYQMRITLDYISDDGDLNYHNALAPTMAEICELTALDSSQVTYFSRKVVEMDDGRIDD
jgi:hypothetical protein